MILLRGFHVCMFFYTNRGLLVLNRRRHDVERLSEMGWWKIEWR
jgi:hypothetical protein